MYRVREGAGPGGRPALCSLHPKHSGETWRGAGGLCPEAGHRVGLLFLTALSLLQGVEAVALVFVRTPFSTILLPSLLEPAKDWDPLLSPPRSPRG